MLNENENTAYQNFQSKTKWKYIAKINLCAYIGKEKMS